MTGFLDGKIAPLIDLIMRLVIARTFFLSGLQKLQDWEATVFLFQYEYAVPVLPHEIAAVMAATFELTMPVLLVLGFATRLAAMPLLGMAFVIQFVLGANNPAFNLAEHYFWMVVLATLIARGAGPISIDSFLKRKFGEV